MPQRILTTDDQLTDWLYKKKPRAGGFITGGRSAFHALDPSDAFDAPGLKRRGSGYAHGMSLRALDPSDAFDRLDPSDAFDDYGVSCPGDLCPMHDMTMGDLLALSEFDGFWSNITSGVKKISKVALEKGVPVLKYSIPGVKDLGDGLKKVGRFVVKEPLFQKALESALPLIPGGAILSGPMLEVAASMVEQQFKKRLIEGGKAPASNAAVTKRDKKTPAPTEAHPGAATLPPTAAAGFSSLPAAGVTKADFAAALGAMSKLPAIWQKVAQRLVRAGVPAPVAINSVGSVATISTPSAADMQKAAILGAAALRMERDKVQLEGFH